MNATKNLVRKKLGLGEEDAIELSQVRDGRIIDLDDGTRARVNIESTATGNSLSRVADDDFEAFRVYASFSRIVEVKVQLPGPSMQNVACQHEVRYQFSSL